MTINIIAAVTHKTFGIGQNNTIPWDIPEDLKRFSSLTKNSVVVMGRKTWDSIPNNKKPLKDRLNIVVTSNPLKYYINNKLSYNYQQSYEYSHYDDNSENLLFVTLDKLNETIRSYPEVFIIGGEFLFNIYSKIANKIYLTVIEKEYDCDKFFSINNLENYQISEYETSKYSKEEQCFYRYITYQRQSIMNEHEEYIYLNLLRDIMNVKERPDRTGIGTKSIFARQLRFDISKTVPFLTTKQLAWKSVLKELLWFIQGKTDSKILEKQNVMIWKGNSTREFLDNRGLCQYEVGDIGAMYGFNWRHFGAEYKGCQYDYTGQGYDQLKNLIEDLKKDPYSRRHMITTFNPTEVKNSVLMPCHGISIQFYVDDDNDTLQKYLSCHVYCRSSDCFLGLPFNIASYAIFTYIIAKLTDMKPRELIISTGDTHIYLNHLEQVNTQLSRQPLPFPILEVSDEIKNKDLNEINENDFNLVGYIHHPAIKASMAV
jgi:dihydrofolate reductase/thymidylate synthase